MSNRLAESRSPYLLQHRDNPVHWQPWDETAISEARLRQCPIFLSIGYAACHWCHVMERESFEDSRIADLLNGRFVCIKVDREERPDLDAIYMNAVQMLTGRGGWPMSVFLTPDLEPFYAGTYFPPHRRGEMPGFDEVIMAVADAWEKRREQVVQQAGEIVEQLRNIASGPERGDEVPPPESIDKAVAWLHTNFDRRWGGFGSAPKFPHVSDLELMLRHGHRTGSEADINAVSRSLHAMARGGLYDVLGGGFARYSVDTQWLVPHFEKMLYDNGLLAGLYIEAYQATGDDHLATVARETLSYIINDLSDPAGGLHSSEDADSEGEEGKYYIWSADEICDALGGDRAGRFIARYGVTQSGNFEGRNILYAARGLDAVAAEFEIDRRKLQTQIDEDRRRLREIRQRRVRPARDDKVLVAWNAMALRALALGGRVLDDPALTDSAIRVAEFLLSEMRTPEGRLLHAWYQGSAHLDAYLDDYAYLVEALVTLYETTGQTGWIERATELAETMQAHFEDTTAGGFFYTADDAESLITRTKEWHDSSTPSSNGVAAVALLRLGRLTFRDDFIESARRTLAAASEVIDRQSPAAGQLLIALDYWHFCREQIVIAATDDDSLSGIAQRYFAYFRPTATLGWAIEGDPPSSSLAPLVEGKTPVDGEVTIYKCRDQTCEPPIVGRKRILSRL